MVADGAGPEYFVFSVWRLWADPVTPVLSPSLRHLDPGSGVRMLILGASKEELSLFALVSSRAPLQSPSFKASALGHRGHVPTVLSVHSLVFKGSHVLISQKVYVFPKMLKRNLETAVVLS